MKGRQVAETVSDVAIKERNSISGRGEKQMREAKSKEVENER